MEETTEEPVELVERVCAIDIGKAGLVVCVRLPHPSRPGRRVQEVREYTAMSPALLGLADWLHRLQIDLVAMEATSDYWKPVFYLLEAEGLERWLREVANTWTGTSWFIEGDVADCFGTLDHQVMLSTLSEKIHDSRFLRLLRGMLQAGYLEDWVWGATLSGAPQGGVASPILSNVYLHKLDVFVDTVLIPQYSRGERRARNPAYLQVAAALARARRRGDRTQVRQLRQRLRSLPSVDPQDPGYRRLRYVRYADDTLLGFAGPKAEAEQTNSAWPSSCMTISSWNCPRTRR